MKSTMPLVHPKTKKSLQIYLKKPVHALLLVGPAGIGKKYLASWLANEIGIAPNFIYPEEDKNSISIDQMRSLYNETKTDEPQIVIIPDARLLGREAQNAFLKLLEEPPRNTYFILTVESANQVLPTIRSRCQVVDVLRPKKSDVTSYYQANQVDLDGLHYTTDGLPGNIYALINDAGLLEEHNELVAQAKSFYLGKVYSRHLMLIENKFEKIWSDKLLDLITLICQALLKTKSDDPKALKKVISQIELLEETKKNLYSNGNTKIHLTKFANLL